MLDQSFAVPAPAMQPAPSAPAAPVFMFKERPAKLYTSAGFEIDHPRNAYMQYSQVFRPEVRLLVEAEWVAKALEIGWESCNPEAWDNGKKKQIFGDTTKRYNCIIKLVTLVPTFNEPMCRLSTMWLALPDEEKAKYVDLAAADKKRFEDECATNPANQPILDHAKQLAGERRKRKGAPEATPLVVLPPPKQKPTKLRDGSGNVIKTSVTPYFHFCSAERARVSVVCTPCCRDSFRVPFHRYLNNRKRKRGFKPATNH